VSPFLGDLGEHRGDINQKEITMAQEKIYTLSGEESTHHCASDPFIPELYHDKENAKKSAIKQFIEFLRIIEVIMDDDNGKECVFLDELEPDGTFDEKTVKLMGGKDENNHVPVEALEKYLNGNDFSHLYACSAHYSGEEYIKLVISEPVFGDPKPSALRFIVVKQGDGTEDNPSTAYARWFPTAKKAREFAKQVAMREQEDNEGSTLISFEYEVVLDRAELNLPNIRWNIEHIVDDDDPSRKCPHCGGKVIPSKIGDYRWQCKKCDEDFYDFECASTK
jgi:ribosomal protein S27AE